jgi:hypothetical protein
MKDSAGSSTSTSYKDILSILDADGKPTTQLHEEWVISSSPMFTSLTCVAIF